MRQYTIVSRQNFPFFCPTILILDYDWPLKDIILIPNSPRSAVEDLLKPNHSPVKTYQCLDFFYIFLCYVKDILQVANKDLSYPHVYIITSCDPHHHKPLGSAS